MNTSTPTLWVILILLLILSGVFAATETALMSLNRYRLRHLAKKNHRIAQRLVKLLRRPDRILSVILMGSTFTNILASAMTTVLAVRWLGSSAVMPATVILTLIILIFSEITPKTLAALYPERIAFMWSFFLKGLLTLLSPLVYLANGISNGLLHMLGIKTTYDCDQPLSREEIRNLVDDDRTGAMMPDYRNMLLRILDLQQLTVNDIMVPRHQIEGLDVHAPWDVIRTQLKRNHYTRLLVYRDKIDQILGTVHVRSVLTAILSSPPSKRKASLIKSIERPIFIPEGTALNIQLRNFRQRKYRLGCVVDEYGSIQGLVTLEDICEEIIGGFTANFSNVQSDIQALPDGSYLVLGSASVRDINTLLDWSLPADGPNTLSGLIIETLEMIPTTRVGLKLAGYSVEVLRIEENCVKLARVFPHFYTKP